MSELFLEILNTGVMAGWLVLAVLIVRVLLRKAPAWAKCALWGIVALRLVWPFSIESMLSLLPSAEIIPPSQLYVFSPQVNTGISSLNTAINPVFSEAFRSEPMNSVNPLQVALWIAGWVWVLGMIAMTVYAIISYLRLHRRVAVSVPMGEGVYLCDHISSPFILGLIKPKIYLPSDLPRENWNSILSHERAHLARRDHWWKPLGFLLLTVFWFHPLLWLAYVLLCRDVELACDERVVKTLSDEEKRDYSETLLQCSIPKKWITACPLAFGETGIKQRIKAVLHYKKPTLWIIIVAVLLCSVLAVCFLTEPVDDPDEPAVISPGDIADKQYFYAGEGAGSAFYINIYENGTFQYYAGVYSSHIGLGDWELKDGKLYLYDTTLSNPMTFVFYLTEDALVYIADESHPFMYVDVDNGDCFNFYCEITKIVPSLMWIEVAENHDDNIIGLDSDGNYWRILLTDHMSRLNLEHTYGGVWVKYYGEPKELSGEDAGIRYEVTAEACWKYVDDDTIRAEKELMSIYDYCLYDVDNDGKIEECIISMGHTSGLFTIYYSVWQDGECEEAKLLLTNHALGFAFDTDENGLFVLSSEGDRYYPGMYSNGFRS